ncbi:hypothetical protein [Methylomonas rhizoryzae]|uniref:hypothetical protein n=1 Tax=Methylomonas rhizoryzae TaxID=2608981 RepID=UPI001231D40C|nr:hypothetical protein [Methylomonas rhizoryzae]
MELTITSVDYAPEELYDQVPIVVKLLREIPGEDRPDYWLGEAKNPIKWIHENHEKEIKHLVLAARWEGTRIEPNAKDLPVGIAYVTDQSLLNDSRLNFSKCSYVAIGISHETSSGEPIEKNNNILAGTIGKLFGVGNRS